MILTLFLSLCLVSGTDININDSINLKGNTNPTQIITVYNNRDIETNNNDVELKTQTIDADNQKDKNTSNPILNSNNQKKGPIILEKMMKTKHQNYQRKI